MQTRAPGRGAKQKPPKDVQGSRQPARAPRMGADSTQKHTLKPNRSSASRSPREPLGSAATKALVKRLTWGPCGGAR